ncbi:GNAT family N-acetyltransferase [Virgibacillus kimchii]
MNQVIRQLYEQDLPIVEGMQTGIEDDYVIRIFERLASPPNRLFGLFVDNQLVSMAGYTIYAKHYAMVGRLRSDIRFKGNGYSTKLTSHVFKEASKEKNIVWVGANTQEHNIPAQRVLEKNRLDQHIYLHGAVTEDTSIMETGAEPWQRITSLERKKKWLEETYIKSGQPFPFECYYPFPGSRYLFHDKDIAQWNFYENEDRSRFLITKTDQKKHHYLHAVYPWDDITSQKGLWETISRDYRDFAAQNEEETYIWMDLTKEEAKQLPAGHAFELPDPWILFGTKTKAWGNLPVGEIQESL